MRSKRDIQMQPFVKNAGLVFLSLVLLPFDTFIAIVAFLYDRFFLRQPQILHNDFDNATVLVTGVNMAKGLSLARLFHRRGHRVIGADTHSLSPARVSRAVDAYYRLPAPMDPSKPSLNDAYLNRMLEIIHAEGVNLWISVSDVNAAIEDAAVKEIIEAHSGAKAVQFGVDDIRLYHEKDSFVQHTKDLGLTTPVTQVVENKSQVIDFLENHGGLELRPGAKQYLIKPVGVDDIARFDMPLLPSATKEATLARIESVPLSTAKCPFIIQQFITGPEYCTHALIIRGRVRTFVACRSADVLMHYEALPVDSPLSKAMLDFTVKQAESRQDDFTGHLSFDFLIEKEDEDGAESGKEKDVTIYPIECNPRVHTATLLFNNTPELVDEYLSVLSLSAEPKALTEPPLSPTDPQRYYWCNQDIVESFLHPLYLTLFTDTMSAAELRVHVTEFVKHVLYWKDGTFEAWDPLPWLWTCHVYWPVKFAGFLMSKATWTKLNVSTGKVFRGD